jgi:sugar phosphate isomerase/epimerase
MKLTRRSFVRTVAASGAAAAVGSLDARKLKPIGVQLYTVRTIIDKNPSLVLRELEGAGFREAEVTYDNIDRIWPALTASKLKPVSLHLPTDFFTTHQEKLGAALDDARKRGFDWVVCPYIAPADRGGVEMIKRLAATLSQAGEKCRAAGLGLAYHNHAFEFAPAQGQSGKILLDVLLAESDPKLVSLELDAFWASVAGSDPVEIVRAQGRRVALIHLKDKAPGIAPRFDENVPKSAFKEVGSGELNIKALLHAADTAGVQHYFVEQDQTPGDPVASLKMSITYLKKLDF